MLSDQERLIQQLRRDEGEVLHAYQDHLGFWTIGVGRLVDQRRGGGISPLESAFLLQNDIERCRGALLQRLPWFAGLDPVRQAAVVNMAFQLGVDGLLQFNRTLASVRDGRYAEAETHGLQSRWAQQTPARARRVLRQIATGEWQ